MSFNKAERFGLLPFRKSACNPSGPSPSQQGPPVDVPLRGEQSSSTQALGDSPVAPSHACSTRAHPSEHLGGQGPWSRAQGTPTSILSGGGRADRKAATVQGPVGNRLWGSVGPAGTSARASGAKVQPGTWGGSVAVTHICALPGLQGQAGEQALGFGQQNPMSPKPGHCPGSVVWR